MKYTHAKGYTLIEIMVALVIFAILATITASSMYQAFDTRAKLDRQGKVLTALQMALMIVSRDTQQMLDRSVRGNEMHAFPSFIGKPNYIEFTRGGLVNPEGQRLGSALQRVAYLCKNHSLIRRSWLRLDTSNRNQYEDKPLITELTSCHFGFLAKNRERLSEWRAHAVRQDQKDENLPTAIQFNFTLEKMGKASLLYDIPRAMYAN